MSKPLNQISAFEDVRNGVLNYKAWWHLAKFDIRGRYRRTVLGPLWTSLNALIFVLVISTVYAQLWGQSMADYLPYLASGYFIWIFITSSFLESCSLYHASGEFLKTAPLSPIMFNMRLVARNLIVFTHSLAVYMIIALIAKISFSQLLWLIPSVVILAVFSFSVSVILSVACSRFRDVEQVVNSILLAAFFITPILYDVSMLGDKGDSSIMKYNFFTYFIDMVRGPLLGKPPVMGAYIICSTITFFTFIGALALYSSSRRRLYLWL